MRRWKNNKMIKKNRVLFHIERRKKEIVNDLIGLLLYISVPPAVEMCIFFRKEEG